MAVITLTGLRARGHHGVLDHERATGQVFLVDLELDVDLAGTTLPAPDTDAVEEVFDTA